jgi:PII-like signaling protein
MEPPEEAVLLRMVVNPDQCWRGRPLYRLLVDRARRLGLAGATAIQGVPVLGRGHHPIGRALGLPPGASIVVEIVDRQEKVDEFLRVVSPMLGDTTVTLVRVQAVWLRTPG